MQFTSFQVHRPSSSMQSCITSDHVEVKDMDGTTLVNKSCGYSEIDSSHSYYFLPPIFLTNTNAVQVSFVSVGSSRNRGWSLGWSAVAPGSFENFVPKRMESLTKKDNFFCLRPLCSLSLRLSCELKCFVVRFVNGNQ